MSTGEPVTELAPPAAASQDEQRPGSTPFERDELLRDHVIEKVTSLQSRYLRNVSSAVAALAKLRRAVNTSPGSDPGIWFDTLDGVRPELLGRDDAPSAHELAIHASLTLYAVHQQSRSESMHRLGYPLGRSVRLLAKRISKENLGGDHPVMRRFHALGTASSVPETLHHLRGLITQLRSESIPLDYGQVALDLRHLQDPRLANGVCLRWSRDYHRLNRKTRSEDAADGAGQPTSTIDDNLSDTDLDAD